MNVLLFFGRQVENGQVSWDLDGLVMYSSLRYVYIFTVALVDSAGSGVWSSG